MNVLTQRNDLGRRGVNAAETRLKPSNVNVNSFGRLHRVPLDAGRIYAQPLYVAQLNFGADGVHDAVFLATMDNRIVVVDAANGRVHNNVQVDGKPPVQSHKYFGDFYQDIVGGDNVGGRAEPVTIGILSTPAVDLEAREIYVVVYTVDAARADAPGISDADRANCFRYILYALDLTTLGRKRSATIGGSVPGTGYKSSGRVAGDGGLQQRLHIADGTLTMRTRFHNDDRGIGVVDATGIGSHDPRVHFNAMMQLQRPGLLLRDGVIYVAFGSRGDWDPYHGWVFAYRAADLAQLDLICTTPNGAQGGIWQAGQGLIADAKGNIYAGTGNGNSKQPGHGQPGTPNMGESFLKLRLANDKLQVVGWYNAFNDLDYRTKDRNDEVKSRDDDLGASAPALLPDGRIIGGGKDGFFYLIDANELIGDAAERQLPPNADNVVLQYFAASYNFERGTRRVPLFLNAILDGNHHQLDQDQATHHIHGAPVAWQADGQHQFVYVWGENDVARAYRYVPHQPGQPLSGGFPSQGAIAVAPLITSDWQHVVQGNGMETARGILAASNEDLGRRGMPGGFLSLSWDGHDMSSAILWACYSPFENGNLQPVAGELVAYDASAFDPQQNFSRLRELWRSRQDPADDFILAKFCCPTVADGRVIVPSGDGSALSIYGLKPPGAGGGYDLGREEGAAFFAGPDGLTLNGSTAVGPAMANPEGRQVRPLALTRNPIQKRIADPLARALVPTFQAGSAFCTGARNVTNIATTFTVQLRAVDPNNMADGFTFTVQTAGPHAIGSAGGGLGYAVDFLDQTETRALIAPSLAVAFSVVVNKVGVWRDGRTGGWLHDLGSDGIALNSGHPIRVRLAFATAQKSLTITVRDMQTGRSTAPLAVLGIDLPGFLNLGNPPLAFFGFTGGTGAKSAEQVIVDWTVP